MSAYADVTLYIEYIDGQFTIQTATHSYVMLKIELLRVYNPTTGVLPQPSLFARKWT